MRCENQRVARRIASARVGGSDHFDGALGRQRSLIVNRDHQLADRVVPALVRGNRHCAASDQFLVGIERVNVRADVGAGRTRRLGVALVSGVLDVDLVGARGVRVIEIVTVYAVGNDGVATAVSA